MMVDFYIGKYTVRPMDPMGLVFLNKALLNPYF